MTEEWRPVIGFEGYYEVSSLGRVRSLDRTVRVSGRWGVEHRTYSGRVLAPQPSGTAKYLGLPLSKGNRITRKLVHDLVLRAFAGPPQNGEEARHLNCVNFDNRLENLAWGSRRRNREDSRAQGTLAVGERIAQHKLTTEEVKQIRAKSGRHEDIAGEFGVSRAQISRIKRGENWAHV